MAFELVPRGRIHRHSAPMVTIAGEGFELNTASSELLKDVQYVNVYFDRDSGRVALGPVKERGPNSYKVTRSRNSARVTPGAWLRALKLPPGIQRCAAQWQEGRLVFAVKLADERAHLERVK